VQIDASGLLREQAAFDVNRQLADVSDDILDPWVAEAAARAAARGVVGIVDLEMAWNRDVWAHRVAYGIRDLRVEFGIYPQHLDRAIDLKLRTGEVVEHTDDLIRVGFHKVLIDGSLNTRTAFCFDEFPDSAGQPDSFGILTVQPEALADAIRRSAGAGIIPTVHAIGDHAVRVALDAFEAAGTPGRIEHAQLVAAQDLMRFARLEIVPSLQPEHAMDDRDVADHHWAGRTDRAFPLRSLLDAGATLALGSDAPVAPLDPWVTIAAAVSRSRDGREPWHPEQAITIREAFAGAARGRAEIAIGDVADLVVTELDPFNSTADQLRTMPVALTLLGGRVTHSAL
jgi:predicted amidohydrolase YtcJ